MNAKCACKNAQCAQNAKGAMDAKCEGRMPRMLMRQMPRTLVIECKACKDDKNDGCAYALQPCSNTPTASGVGGYTYSSVYSYIYV